MYFNLILSGNGKDKTIKKKTLDIKRHLRLSYL